MDAMIAFLQRNRNHPHVVIIDDISRLARGMKAHIGLRDAIAHAGGVLKSPSIDFSDDADSELQEYIMATVSQHQRRKNAEQTLNRMKSRMRNGYWVFSVPVGYRFVKGEGSGKVLVRDEPIASIIQEALEGYASGRLQSQAEVMRYFAKFPEFPRNKNGDVVNQRARDILTHPVYSGYIDHAPWGLSMVKAKHEPSISLETYQRIQDRLNGGATAPARKDLNTDFPLRGFVTCGDCCNPLSAYWARSKTGKRHPYYQCHTKSCTSYRKTIRRDDLEGQFETVLKAMQPTEGLFKLAKAMFRDAWDQRIAQASEIKKSLKRQLANTEKQIDQLLDRVVESSSSKVIRAYETKIEKLERQKLIAAEKLENAGQPRHTFAELFEPAMAFLSSPWKIWDSGRLDMKRLVLRLAFAERLPYYRNQGFRTPEMTLPFKALRGIQRGKLKWRAEEDSNPRPPDS